MWFCTRPSTMDKLRINIQLGPLGTQREMPSIAFNDGIFFIFTMAQLFNPDFAAQPVVHRAARLWTRVCLPKKYPQSRPYSRCDFNSEENVLRSSFRLRFNPKRF